MTTRAGPGHNARELGCRHRPEKLRYAEKITYCHFMTKVFSTMSQRMSQRAKNFLMKVFITGLLQLAFK